MAQEKGIQMISPLGESILIFGGSGLVGSAIAESFQSEDFALPNQVITPTRSEVDLIDYKAVKKYISDVSPNMIIMAAGLVGGISFNATHQEELYSSNLLMNYNLLKVAFDLRVSKFLLISSSCLYPAKLAPPFSEGSIFMGLPEPTNDGYAAAKIAAIRQLLMYRNNYNLDWKVCIPTNAYGITEMNFEKAHVIPQMIHKIMQAKMSLEPEVEFFGDGTPIREFIFNSDLASAIVWIYSRGLPEPIMNISTRRSVSIKELARIVADSCEYQGELIFNPSFPNGHPNKSLDNRILTKSGWKPKMSLEEGIALLVRDYMRKTLPENQI